ncbi:hypothetical protein [Planctomicrobium sp. SH527]|uniref:hypothetical protein n=1 Tax=Planctomicrobium sp. SH527 TaxID=3448123 RepID=UPI003F5C31EC
MTVQHSETKSDRKYIPGVCNLGRNEVFARYATALIGYGITVGIAFFMIVNQIPPLARIAIILPAFIGSIGFLQAFWKFCAAYGIRGVFNVSSSIGKTDTVEQAEFRKKDRRTAIVIIWLSFLIASCITAIVCVFPA